MNAALQSARAVSTSLEDDDERSLLIGLELLLEREEQLLESRGAEGLCVVAEERERLTARLVEAAQARRKTMHLRTVIDDDGGARRDAEDAELIELYQRLRQRHDVRARVVRRHSDRNARAVGVLAQASNQAGLYGADGRVPVQWTAA
ncbi:MAG: hypothetical protein ACR2GP_12870 [Burkholderiaceae bacterium]